jgi:hypothetical protein
MINDKNTLFDIHGVILCLQADLYEANPEFPVMPAFEELVERIEDKLKRNRNVTRGNWFSESLEYANRAKKHFENSNPDESERMLSKCWKRLEQGNKAHKRSTNFIISPDGTASKTK